DYDGSQILRSTDAGATWRAVLPTWPLTQISLQVTGAFFLNADDAWAETQHEWPAQPGVTTIWQTTDGGVSWHQGISLPGASQYGTAGFDEFAFADARHGFGFGVAGASTSGFEQQREDSLWATSDGGRHWGEVAARGLPWEGSTYSGISAKGCYEPDPFNLTAVSASVVFLTEAGCPVREPGLWRSTDGGHDWAPVDLPPPPGGWARAEAWHYPGVGETGAEVLALRSFAGGPGVVAVTTRPGQLLVYRSSDAGEPWSLASVLETGSLDRPAGFWASSPSAWELPAPAGLYVTTDAGRHWGLQSSGPSLDMTEVSFASPASGIGFPSYPEVGLASTGDDGMRTGDGGRSWESVQFSGPAFLGNFTAEVPFGTVDFANALDGWVGGADGVAATTDAGAAWAPQLATPEPVEELSFADAEHGWALTADELFATSDGGAHWSAVPGPALGAFSYVELVAPGFGVGVICGQTGGTRAVATHDEGGSWSLLPVPGPDALQCGTVPPSPGIISGICFGTSQVGWAVLHGPGEGHVMVEKTDDGGLHWSAVAAVNFPPSAFTCQGASAAWLGFTYGEHGGEGAVAGTTDGGRNWGISARPVPGSPVLIPQVSPTDGTAVITLGTSQSPTWLLSQPVGALAAPSAGTVVELWRDYSAACISGFGLALSSDGGTTWSAAPETTTTPPPCGTTSLPYLSAGSYLAPSLSFPDVADGFVLAPAAGTPALPERPLEVVPMALVATTDGGQSWHLLYSFPWREPISNALQLR
ncbi:MAG TPA: hypothetical protein VK425_07845, partial [Acidimicrobiales bacterium]|nr:hypothetical protein [Acidimicrobiales bacterium]